MSSCIAGLAAGHRGRRILSQLMLRLLPHRRHLRRRPDAVAVGVALARVAPRGVHAAEDAQSTQGQQRKPYGSWQAIIHGYLNSEENNPTMADNLVRMWCGGGRNSAEERDWRRRAGVSVPSEAAVLRWPTSDGERWNQFTSTWGSSWWWWIEPSRRKRRRRAPCSSGGLLRRRHCAKRSRRQQSVGMRTSGSRDPRRQGHELYGCVDRGWPAAEGRGCAREALGLGRPFGPAVIQ